MFVISTELASTAEEQSRLFERIPLVEDLQAWLLLTFCAATRANYQLRTASGVHARVRGETRPQRDQVFGADPQRGPCP